MTVLEGGSVHFNLSPDPTDGGCHHFRCIESVAQVGDALPQLVMIVEGIDVPGIDLEDLAV